MIKLYTKRALSILLFITLLISLFPFSALAYTAPVSSSSVSDFALSQELAMSVTIDGRNADTDIISQSSSVITVTLNRETLNNQIETAADNITIGVPYDTDTAVVELSLQNVADLSAKNIRLVIQSGNIRYELPALAFNTVSVTQELGAADARDVSVNIIISKQVGADIKNAVAAATMSGTGDVIVPPIEFKVTASYAGNTVDVNKFSKYVSRGVTVTTDQADKIATAVVIESDGSVRHVPTFLHKNYAALNSFTNSTYAIIHNEIAFNDAEGEWYEDVVNEMGTRMIISGITDTEFGGDNGITRAEFAAIIIIALGLPADGDNVVFDDVPDSSEFYGAISNAYEYGIIAGKGDGMFAPNELLTRQEAMVIAQRAAQLAGFAGTDSNSALNSFSDAQDVSRWALSAAQWNTGSGIVNGSNGLLRPHDNITRAEAATLVLKLLQNAQLIDIRTLMSAKSSADELPRIKPDPIVEPDSDDDAGIDDTPDNGSTITDTGGDLQNGDSLTTPHQAIQALNDLLAACNAAQGI